MKTLKFLSTLLFITSVGSVTLGQLTYYKICLPSYPPGGVSANPGAINDLNQVCGPIHYCGDAYIWADGQRQPLPFESDSAGLGKEAYDINNLGHVVGSAKSTSAGPQFYNGVDVIEIGTLSGRQAQAYALNDKDQIVGRAKVHTTKEIYYPFLWENGTMTPLGTLGGMDHCAFDINENSVVVGYGETAEGSRNAFVWEEGTMKNLGTLGGDNSTAFSINDSNSIVGYSEIENGYRHACIWENGQVRDLGTLGGNQSQAFAINNDGLIAGWAETETGYRPMVVWSGSQIIRLQTLVPADSGWELVIPVGETCPDGIDINNNGSILGHGFINGKIQPCVMTPTQRPVLTADFNGDQKVDLADFETFSSQWLK